MSIETLEQEIYNCNKCVDMIDARLYPMPNLRIGGKVDRLFMFIGENPGAPLPGESDIVKSHNDFKKSYEQTFQMCKMGKFIKYILDHLNYTWEDVIMTNICKCATPNNRKINDEEMNNCSIFLNKQIDIFEPKYIITMGTVPLQRFIPDGRISQYFGTSVEFDTYTLVPIYHPSYISRQVDKVNIVNQCIGNIRRVL